MSNKNKSSFLIVPFLYFMYRIFFFSNYSYSADVSLARDVLKSDYLNNTGILSISQSKQSILSRISNYEDLLKACQESKLSTDKFCFEGNDKGINQFSSMMGSLTDVGSMAMSASCNKLASILKYGQGALLAFRGTCSAKKSDCIDKCSQAEKIFSAIKRDMNSLNNIIIQNASNIEKQKQTSGIQKLQQTSSESPPSLREAATEEVDSRSELLATFGKDGADNIGHQASVDNAYALQKAISALDESNNDPDSPSLLKRACESTQAEATGKATMNLTNLMMSMQKNSACAKDLTNFDTGLNLADCNLTGTCTTTPTPNECQDPQFKDSIYCKTPTTTGTDTRGAGGGMASTKPTTPDFNLNTGNLKGLSMDGLGGSGADGTGGPGNIPDTPGPKSAGVPGGAGGGGLSIPGTGGTPPNKGGGSRGVSSDGTNYGGSPSYAGGTVNTGGSGDKNKDDLQQYLPGGIKDPNLAKIGGPEGITAAGGPTIFEKVTRSYKNNRSTLIPE